MIESSYNSILAGHQIFVQSGLLEARAKRRKFHINRCCAVYKESITIKMSTESADTVIDEVTVSNSPKSVPTELSPKNSTSDRAMERRGSRESSEGDLVHVSEESSVNNENTQPNSGEATPLIPENQQVELKFDRRDSQVDTPPTIVQQPHLATNQRRDVKEPGYDEIEDAIQLSNTCMLTKKNEWDGKPKKQVWKNVNAGIGIGLSAILIGTYIYFKYR